MTDYLIAAMSGILAGVSACTIPLYPVLLNQITRMKEDPRWASLFFMLGLTSVYFMFYAIIGALAQTLGFGFIETMEEFRGRMILAGALVAWFMAFKSLKGGLGMPTLKIFKRIGCTGYLGAFSSGFVFGGIVTPCNAPFLITGILPALASSHTVLEGILHLSVFSIALGAPILALGWMSGTALRSLDILKRNLRYLEVASGLFLVVVGFYFMYLFLLSL